MRRATLAVLVLGCLALSLGTVLGPNVVPQVLTTTVSAQSPLHPCTVACGNEKDHYAFCHVDHGGEGHVICPDSSSIAKHLENHANGDTPDRCISNTDPVFTEEDCLAIKK